MHIIENILLIGYGCQNKLFFFINYAFLQRFLMLMVCMAGICCEIGISGITEKKQ